MADIRLDDRYSWRRNGREVVSCMRDDVADIKMPGWLCCLPYRGKTMTVARELRRGHDSPVSCQSAPPPRAYVLASPS